MKTIWILGDQLTLGHPALEAVSPRNAVVLFVESKAHGEYLQYHKLKLALVFSAMRHFARDLRAAGWQVDYRPIEGNPTFEDGLRRHLQQFAPDEILVAQPNSFAETDAVEKLGRKLRIPITPLPTRQFLLSREEFRQWAGDRPRLLMETHYRETRKRFGWLMEPDGQPAGGAWNFDPLNRATYARWKRDPAARPPPRVDFIEPDEITRAVLAMVDREFPEHPGATGNFWLPVDRGGALCWLRDFIDRRLPLFGAYEDMMSVDEPLLFHSVLSPLLNLGLLTPRECIEAAIAAYESGAAPLNSVEGFVRQIAGWREFINGVYWLRGPEYQKLNALGATRPLPPWFHTGETEMNCLRRVLEQNLTLGWNHHIQRLMILGNFLLIAGIDPAAALRWFNERYIDAFDWVMAANVIGMTLHADGGFMATKPYAATGAYINKMSDYCAGCRFDPAQKTGAQACPYNYLYWNFVDAHAARFAEYPRMRAIVRAWIGRSAASQEAVRASARSFLGLPG